MNFEMTLFRGAFLAAVPMALAAVTSAVAHAADSPSAKPQAVAPAAPTIPQVGGDDIFGFTTPTDLGNPGDRNFVNENDGRLGKRDGSYGALNTKYQLSYTITEDWWVGASPFLAFNRVRNVTGFNDRSTVAFDGFSAEFGHRFVARSLTNPFGVTATIEPRWGRIDGESGFRSENVGFTSKLFIDAVLVPDTVFWAMNLNWGPQWSKDPLIPGNNLINSTTLVSNALTWQFAPGFFFGGEVRYFATFERIIPDHLTDQAVFAGPTFLWKINKSVAVNATWQPQIWGRAEANPALRLDLDGFEKSLFRLKLAVQF